MSTPSVLQIASQTEPRSYSLTMTSQSMNKRSADLPERVATDLPNPSSRSPYPAVPCLCPSKLLARSTFVAHSGAGTGRPVEGLGSGAFQPHESRPRPGSRTPPTQPVVPGAAPGTRRIPSVCFRTWPRSRTMPTKRRIEGCPPEAHCSRANAWWRQALGVRLCALLSRHLLDDYLSVQGAIACLILLVQEGRGGEGEGDGSVLDQGIPRQKVRPRRVLAFTLCRALRSS